MKWRPDATRSRIWPPASRRRSRARISRPASPALETDSETRSMETSLLLDFLGELRRTHSCGALRESDAGANVILMGWVHRRRDHGGVIFVDLRDREGITQVVFHEDVGPEVHERAEEVRPEYVIAVEGKIEPRGAAAVNPNLATGEIELVASKVWILNESRTPPFPMEEQVDVAEEARLKYRYVDLRRPRMQRNIILQI